MAEGLAVGHIQKRGNTWHFRMRVPERFRDVEPRAVVKATLRTDSQTEAEFAAERLRRELVAGWNARLAGVAKPEAPAIPFEQLEAIAKERHAAYRPQDQIPIDQLILRVLALKAEDPLAKRPELAAAVLGAAPTPDMRMSDLPAFYERERRTENAGKTEDAMRKWRNPIKLAVAGFVDVAGDLKVAHLSHEEAIAYADWWKDRVADGEVTAATANKSIGFLRIMTKAHDRRFRLSRLNPFDGLSITGGLKTPVKRLEFSESWIRENLMCADPLPGLNEEARDLVILCAWTGARPSELSGVLPHHMRTKDPIPHIQIREEGRKLKTPHSVRDLPLLGLGLEAAKRHPNGFPRYAGKAGLSDTVNKYLRDNGLLPSSAHTMYSLRHAFEGRMTRAGVDNRHAAQMMGHSIEAAIGRQVYGDKLTLEQRLAIARRVTLDT